MSHDAGVAFCVPNAMGVAAIYGRQAEGAWPLGPAGFILVELMCVPSAAFQVVEGRADMNDTQRAMTIAQTSCSSLMKLRPRAAP